MLPSDPQKRKVAIELLNRDVQLLREMDQLKEDRKQLKEEAEEEICKDFAKDFQAMSKLKHSIGKFENELEKKTYLLEEVKILDRMEVEINLYGNTVTE